MYRKLTSLSLLFVVFFFIPLYPTMPAFGAKVVVITSVDWEGRELSPHNLQAMQIFRQRYPHIPLLHFLNAAYFFKPGVDADKVKEKIQSVLRIGDEQGLHLHGWKRLFEASGVDYRSTPQWTPQWSSQSCSYDCGHDIPISAYTQAELQKVIRTSVSTLQKYGFERPISFRAGGWMLSAEVAGAIMAEGFLFDSSEVPVELFKNQLNGYKIPQWVRELWPDADVTSRPYVLRRDHGQSLIEIPDNGCLADYMSAKEMLEVFKKNASFWQKNPEKTVFVSIGFHQETAKEYLPRVEGAIDLIEKWAEENGVPLEWAQLPLQRYFKDIQSSH